MIYKPWKIGLKAAVCLFFLFIIITFLCFSVNEITDTMEYSSVEAKMARMEALYASGDFARLNVELRYSPNNYREEFDAIWEIAKTYNELCTYESYVLAAERAEEDMQGYYENRAAELKSNLETVCEEAVYPENQKAYQYFIRRAGLQIE
ncbi:MAG TPA: hypothetical protein VJZ01_10450 [Lachnospiraceae bacterium]|jgi:hypothetical protein|nr:hypothetical protein [Lachnospiraceae bacterium]